MEHLPLSVGIIANGNRTWAKREYQTEHPTMDQYLEAYRRGSERVRGVIEEARDLGFKLIAAWGMSDKNIVNRPPNERKVLYQIYEYYLTDLRDNFMRKEENAKVRFVHIGRRDRLAEEAPRVIQLIDEVTEETRNRMGMAVVVALDYGGRNEQERAEKLWFAAGCPDGTDGIRKYLDLPRQGIAWAPIDFIVRTGHKQDEAVRTNEFLYPYLDETRVIPNTCMLPDYTKEHFRRDIDIFTSEKQNRGA